MSNKTEAAAPAMSLPKGGGAIRGIGETFQSNVFTGTANHAIPLALSPGRGFQPELSVRYASANGNGPFGLGWDLGIPRITRKTEKGLPRYDDSDTFVLSGGEDLVPVLRKAVDPGNGETVWLSQEPVHHAGHTVHRYRPRTEGTFARIERWVHDATDDVHWRSITRDNVTHVYGRTAASRLADPGDPLRVFAWLLDETVDPTGNRSLYEYARDHPALYTGEAAGLAQERPSEHNRVATQLYIRRIYYGNLPAPLEDDGGNAVTYPDGSAIGHLRNGHRYAFEVVFDYGDWDEPTVDPHPEPPPDGQQELFGVEAPTLPDARVVPVRPDCFSQHRSRFEIRTLRRCRRVLMFHHFAELGGPTLVRSMDFAYRDDSDTALSFLVGVTVTSYQRDENGGYRSASMPPVTVRYAEFTPGAQRYQSLTAPGRDMPGLPLDAGNMALVDVFGDGLPDVVESSPAGWRYWRNLGAGVLDRPRSMPDVPAAVALAAPGVSFGDVDGDGKFDLMLLSAPVRGSFESTAGGGWGPFKPFEAFPTVDLASASVRFLDLTGNGLSDALMTTGEDLVWFACLGDRGFGPPQAIARIHDPEMFPDVFFDDPEGRVRLADMNADGLVDIVLLHNDRIDYWPNLGFGRFGRRLTMENAPHLDTRVLAQRLFLADLNGTGCADLVYVDVDRVHFWFNQSGNRWSERHTIAGTPIASSTDAVQFADVFGTGTATLVWSAAQGTYVDGNYKALDFCGGVKPYLLVEMSNNLGSTTRVTYGSSTRHFLRDRAEGTPWVTHLPFPVQVVDRVEVIDHVANTGLVSTYRYHHGCYDGREREFRGFGRVDQFDADLVDAGDGPVAASSGDSRFGVAPVETRSWFHTGLYFDSSRSAPGFEEFDEPELTRAFRREFYTGDAEASPLEVHDVETGASPYDAYRALRGSLVRTEIYGRDGSAKAAHPYLVTEKRYRVVELQPEAGEFRGVHFSHEVERVEWHYERDPADPRVGHTLTLQVDEFGQTRRTIVVGYGRRRPDASLTPAEQQTQSRTLVTYSESDYTNAIDHGATDLDNYRAPLPSETRTFELTGFSPSRQPDRFTAGEWTENDFAPLASAAELRYEETPDGTAPQRRLIEDVRVRYRRDDLTDLLPLGQLEPLALPGETVKLAFTPALIAHIYGDRVTDAMLAGDARYVHSEGDGNWWQPSGRTFYSPGAADGPADELAFARRHFFLPHRFRDPFGHTSLARHDAYGVLLRDTMDPVGNRTSVENDYRVLLPRRMTDPNGNRIDVVFDTRGIVTGTAVMGKASETIGDTLAGFVPDLAAAQQQQFLDDPIGTSASLLGGATTRFVYDLDRFRTTGEPVYMAMLARDTHASEPVPAGGLEVQVYFTYSDGFGREIQKKSQAEPGPVEEGGPSVDPRWVASGWTAFNTKGQPVREFEPFFDGSHAYRAFNEVGVSATLGYDPLGRMVATLHANHTWAKTVLGAWRQDEWDVNDTVLVADPADDSDVGGFFRRLPEADYLPTWHAARAGGAAGPAERAAAEQTALHAATPSVAHADPLGRNVLTVTHNRFTRGDVPVEEFYRTRIHLDIEGNQRALVDPRGRMVGQFEYDMLGTRVRQRTMDAGERLTLADAAEASILAWDSRGHRFRSTYDGLRRPLASFLQRGSDPEILIGRTIYGEALPQPEANNLRGKLVEAFDQAGVITTSEYDFKANRVSSTRRFARAAGLVLDWSANPVLEQETFTGRTDYDALNRTIASSAPDGSIYRATFGEGSLVQRVAVVLPGQTDETPFVTNIDYNAKGQRTRIDYANGVTTRYDYDPNTFQLTRLRTDRASDGARLQDLAYTYDPSDNITRVGDRAQQTIFFANQVVTADQDYTYDATYRLVIARGREHVGSATHPETTWDDAVRTRLAHPGDGTAMRRYTERYEYDEAGNILQVIHRATGGDWTRTYEYGEASLLEPGSTCNRLSRTIAGNNTPTIEEYLHDAHGNITSMPHLAQMEWNFRDQLAVAGLGGGGTVRYAYDGAGVRTRKLIERNGAALTEERLYLGGFESFRRRDGTGTLTAAHESLFVTCDGLPVALVERHTVDNSSPVPVPAPRVRFQLGNHLRSSCLEVDPTGRVVSYEEYYPYGGTSYQAVASDLEVPKRYRFTAMERDEESGFTYHAARYYAPWLGRWVSCDPAGFDAGLNLYTYCHGDPVGSVDPAGTDPPPDAVTKTVVKGDKIITTSQIQREGLYSVLVTTIDHSGYYPKVTKVLYRRAADNEHWVDVTDQARRGSDLNPPGTPKGEISIEWNMPSLMTDAEKIRNIKSPGLLYGFMPFHAMPYLKDQTLGIKNPMLRMQASAMQQTMRAVDVVTADLIEYGVTEAAGALGHAGSTARALTSVKNGSRVTSQVSRAVSTGAEVVAEGADGAVAVAPTLASPRIERALLRNASNVTSKSGRFDVVVHSDGMNFWVKTGPKDADWAKVPVKRVAEFMKRNGYQGGPVRLIACHSGSCPTGAAQKLANELGAGVKAPTQKTWIHPDGRITQGPKATSNTGSWVWFKPQKK